MGILVNQNQIGGGGTSNSSRNIGDIFYTTRTDNSLNGAVECNGSQYNFSDFDSNLQSLLDNGSIPSISIDKFDKMVAEQGGCDSFGYGTDAEWTRWEGPERLYVYTNKASTKAEVGDPVYDAPGGNIIGYITRIDSENRTYIVYEDTDGTTSYSAYWNASVDGPDDGPVDSTPYFKVPKKLSRVLVRTQKPTADNNYTWYNVYADGWVEQGGKITLNGIISDNNKIISLPIRMANTKYYNSVSQDANAGGTPRVTVGWQSKTTMTVGFVSTGGVNGQVSWQVAGYANSAEYTKDKWNYQNVQVERCMVQLFNSTTDTAVATCNQVLADVSALNQGDYVIETQLPTKENNYTWYRLYKSGWVEQGKFRNSMESNVNTTCMLIIPMKDTNYFVTGLYDTNTNAINSLSRIGVGAKTTQSFQMRTEGGQYSWEVKGFSNITN